MAYEDLESGGSIYQGGGQSNYTPSSAPFNPGGDSSLLAAQFTNTNMSETLRSFKDTMAFSFQTLNLTLSSLTNTLGNLTSKIGNASTSLFASAAPQSPFANAPTNYIQRNYSPGIYPSSVPDSYVGMSMSGQVPGMEFTRDRVIGNIGTMQFFSNRERETPYRAANDIINYGVNGSIAALDLAGQFAAGSMLGGGILGGFGGALIGGIPAMVAGAVARPFAEDAIVHNKDVYNIQNMSARFGDKFTTRQAQRVVKDIDEMAYKELMTTSAQDVSIGMQGYRDITMMGLQSNLFSGSTPDQLSKQVSSAAQVVKFLADAMGNTDVKQAMQSLKQLKEMGVNLATDPNMARKLGSAAFKYSSVTGIQPDQLMSTAANMAVGSYGAYRNPAFVGIESGMRNIAFLRELEKRKMLTPAEIAAAGGIEAMGTRQMGFQAGMLNSNIGTAMLYSAATPGGGFDTEAFKRASKGTVFDMASAAGKNLYKRGPLGMVDFLVNRTEMIANAGKDGKIDERMDTVLFNMIKVHPLFRIAKTGRDQINVAALMIKEYAPMFGQELTEEDAKAMATRIIHKSVGVNLENKADRAINLAQNAKNRASYSLGAQFSRIGTGFSRIKGTIFEGIARGTRDLADELTAGISEKTGVDSYLNTGDTVASDTFGMYREGAELNKEANAVLDFGVSAPTRENNFNNINTAYVNRFNDVLKALNNESKNTQDPKRNTIRSVISETINNVTGAATNGFSPAKNNQVQGLSFNKVNDMAMVAADSYDAGNDVTTGDDKVFKFRISDMNNKVRMSKEINNLLSNYDFGKVIDAIKYNESAGSGISPWQAVKGSPFFSGNMEAIAAMVAANTSSAYKDYATLALDEKTGTAASLFSSSGLFAGSADYNRFKKAVTDTDFFGDVKPEQLAIKTADYVMNEGGRGYSIRARAEKVGKLDNNVRASLLATLQASSGKQLQINSQGRIMDMSANQAMYSFGMNREDPTYRLLLEAANKSGFKGTEQQKVARMTSLMFGVEGGADSLATMYAGSDQKDINNAMVATLKLNPDVAGSINKELTTQNINTNTLGLDIAKLTGVDAKFINNFSDTYGAKKTREEMQALGDYIAEVGKTGTASKEALNKFQTDKMRQIATSINKDKVSRWMLDFKDSKGRNVFQRKSSMISGYEVYGDEATDDSWDKFGALIKANGANIMMNNAEKGLVKSVESLGLKMDDKEAYKMLSNTTGEGFKQLEEKINSQGTKWAQEQLRQVKKMSNEDLSRLIGSNVTEQDRSGAMVTAMRYVAGSEGQRREADNQANKTKVTSMIDTAVDTSSGIPYVRVIQVNDEVKEARKKQEEAAKNSKISTESVLAKQKENDYKYTHFGVENN